MLTIKALELEMGHEPAAPPTQQSMTTKATKVIPRSLRMLTHYTPNLSKDHSPMVERMLTTSV